MGPLLGGNGDEKPINQEDLLGTTLAFVVPVFRVLDNLGVGEDPDDRAAYCAMWCAIGHLLGVDHRLVTVDGPGPTTLLTVAAATERADAISARHQRRNRDGTWLLEELLEDVGDHFPIGMMHMPDVLLRLLGGDRTATMLLGPQREGPLLRPLLAGAVGVFRSALARPFVPKLLDVAADLFLREFVKEHFGHPYLSPWDPVHDAEDSNLPIGCTWEAPVS